MSAPRTQIPRIVVGVDGSAPSLDALRWAIRQAEATGGTLDAVMAWQYPVAIGGLGWAPAAGMDDVDYAALAAQALTEAIDAVEIPDQVHVRQVVVEGNAAQALLDSAKDADLLVVGNRGHGGFTDALIGSVSGRCVHHAHCPVVVVRATPAQS
ncbi:MAG: universal stress protein [Streptosporangiaceae bacterium]